MRRLLWILTLSVICIPSVAAADPIRYTFSATVDGQPPDRPQTVSPGTIVTGGFLFDPDAKRLSYSEGPTPPDGGYQPEGLMSRATYDATNFLLWLTVANTTITTTGTLLDIQNVQPGSYGQDHWRLNTKANTLFGPVTVDIVLITLFGRGLDTSDLHVPDLAPDLPNWHDPWGSHRRLFVGDAEGTIFAADITAITREVAPVPEPSSVALLAVGAVTLRAARRRHNRAV